MCLSPSHDLGVSINNSLTMFKIHYLNMTEPCFFSQWLNNMSHKEMHCLWCYLYAHLIPCWKLWLNMVSTPGKTTTNYRSPYVYCFTKHLPQCYKNMDCSFLLDCLQSAFSLKICLVLISSSAITKHNVIITETRREKRGFLFSGLRPRFSQLPTSPLECLGFTCSSFAKKSKRLLTVQFPLHPFNKN